LGFLPLEAACLAKESTRSFPGMPLWKRTHAKWIEMPSGQRMKLVPYEGDKIDPDFKISEEKASNTLLESEKIAADGLEELSIRMRVW